VFAGYRKGTDKENTRQPDQRCYENRDVEQKLFPAEHLIAKAVVEQREGNGPPGHDGVHGSSQQPGAHQVPDLFTLVEPLFGRKQLNQPGKVNRTEGDGQYAGPLQSQKAHVPQQVAQRILSCIEVENFKGDQGNNQYKANGRFLGYTVEHI